MLSRKYSILPEMGSMNSAEFETVDDKRWDIDQILQAIVSFKLR